MKQRIAEAMIWLELQEDGSISIADTSAGLEDDLPAEQLENYRELHAALADYVRAAADDLATVLANRVQEAR